MRPAFFTALARPFFWMSSRAFSTFASASTRALRQSFIPAPERSRTCLTRSMVISFLLMLVSISRLVSRSAAVAAIAGAAAPGHDDLRSTRLIALRRGVLVVVLTALTMIATALHALD